MNALARLIDRHPWVVVVFLLIALGIAGTDDFESAYGPHTEVAAQ